MPPLWRCLRQVMRVNGIEEGSLLKIDEILLRDLDKEEKLRTVGAAAGWQSDSPCSNGMAAR